MNNNAVFQDYDAYGPEDHQTWATLYKRQIENNTTTISKGYLNGLNKLKLDGDKIIRIEEMSKRMEAISGWSLIPVSGLIPTRDFFYMLINKKYPVTVSIRRPHEIDFSEQPDIFHDVCGHLPLLTNEEFTKFLTAYSIIALKYINNEKAIDFLGRLYWYTYEMGLINENGEYMPYGGAIITSAGEIVNVQSSNVPKYPFDIARVFKTVYDPYKLQNEYFVIDSFDDLFNCIESLETKLIEHLLLPDEDYTLRNYSLNNNLGAKFNNVIGFLNDVQYQYPDVVSFVAGQPDQEFFDVESSLQKFDEYVRYVQQRTGNTRKDVVGKIGQYGKTKGIVNELVAEYLRKDENIILDPEHILLTVGAQEAFSIIVSTICNRSEDVILVEDPGYIGLSSFAKVFDNNIEGIPVDDEGIELKSLRNKIIEVNRSGKTVKLVYVIPDYQNPSGVSMPVGNRLKLLELAKRYNFLIIEDSVYNSMTYAQKRTPTLKSLDKYNRVIYVGSFSKSLFPGLRIGLIGANQLIENETGETVLLIDEMVKVKAQLTNNTSAISQAILGGVLLHYNCSLSDWSKPKFLAYKSKRDKMIAALSEHIGAYRDSWAEGISWNEPDGGFFIKMSLPFTVSPDDVVESAKKFKVIFCPMKYFYVEKGGDNEIRLTFSNLTLDAIETGVQRLAAWTRSKAGKTRSAVLTEGESVNA